MRITGYVLTAVLAIAITGAGRPVDPQSAAELDRVMRAQVNRQSWDDGGEVSHWAYLHTSEVFPVAAVGRAGPVRELPVHLRPEIGDFPLPQRDGRKQTLQEYIAHSDMDGFLILHQGAIVYEQYPHMQAADRHLSFSVTKAFIGTALGILESEGRIDVGKPVEKYLPDFAGTQWAGTRVRDIADMASGMEGVEDTPDAYSNPQHKQFQMEASLGWQPISEGLPPAARDGDTYELLKGFRRIRPAGQVQAYTSANTEVLADLLERVTGLRLAELISRMMWSKIGAENDALLVVNDKGYPVAHAGMVMTLRDLARFGLWFTPSGADDPGGGVPPAFLQKLLKAREPALQSGRHPAWFSHSGYQWDAVTKNGQIAKGGFANQLLFVDTRKDVVIAYFGTNTNNQEFPTPLPLVALIDKYF